MAAWIAPLLGERVRQAFPMLSIGTTIWRLALATGFSKACVSEREPIVRQAASPFVLDFLSISNILLCLVDFFGRLNCEPRQTLPQLYRREILFTVPP